MEVPVQPRKALKGLLIWRTLPLSAKLKRLEGLGAGARHPEKRKVPLRCDRHKPTWLMTQASGARSWTMLKSENACSATTSRRDAIQSPLLKGLLKWRTFPLSVNLKLVTKKSQRPLNNNLNSSNKLKKYSSVTPRNY